MNLFMEKHNIKQAGVPADLNLAGLTGARVKLDGAFKCAVVVSMGDSVGAAVDFSLQQHDAASAGTSKALNIVRNYYRKADVETAFTKVEIRPDDAGLSDSVDLAAVFAAAEGIVVFEVLAEDLDRENGFGWISLNIGDPGAAKVFNAEYVLRDNRQEPAYDQDL